LNVRLDRAALAGHRNLHTVLVDVVELPRLPRLALDPLRELAVRADVPQAPCAPGRRRVGPRLIDHRAGPRPAGLGGRRAGPHDHGQPGRAAQPEHDAQAGTHAHCNF
jgi:hypothetical protein